MNEQIMKKVSEYNALPSTPEKKKINKAYLSDEIGSLEFFSKAFEYLRANPESKE